ncbi:MAG: hypothetical protein AABX39_04725 [Nanoarchaeota archaeon]
MDSKLAFDRELDEYLSERKKTRVLHNIIQGLKRESNKINLHPSLETYTTSAPQQISLPNGEREEKPRKGFLARLFSPEEEEPNMAEQLNAMRSDMKQLAKITLDVIKKMPPQEVATFKQSDDFAVLKELLKKHSLIK